MTWKEARIIAVGHLRRLQVPRRLDGVTVQLTEYDDNETLRFLKVEEPDITLETQRILNQALAREVRKRGAIVRFVPVNINDYFSWLGKHSLNDNNHMRAQYIAWLTAPDPKPVPVQA